MATKDVRQINWRATPPTADLLDLAILVRQTVDNDPTFTVKRAAEEAIRSWAVDQLADHPDIAARSAVGLTLGAATATRSFQAIRIAVNAEFSELAAGLAAAERALKPGGKLAVVSFHSLEDRIVKRFFLAASGQEANANRYAPATETTEPRFTMATRKAIAADATELAQNPRSRSAKLRIGIRTDAPASAIPPADLGLPTFSRKGRR